MGSKSDPPPATDPVATAQAQGAANKDAAVATGMMSNPNIISPYGNQTVSYAKDPDTGNQIPTITQTLDPTSQDIFNHQQQTRLGLADLSNTGLGIAQGTLNSPFQYNGPGVQTSLGNSGQINSGPSMGDFGQAQTSVQGPNLQGSIDTSGVAKMPVNAGTTGYDALMSRLQPQMDRQNTSLQTQLTNQGLRPGDEAWDNAMKDQSYGQNDLMTQAAAQGVNLDLSANNQGFNQAAQQGAFSNDSALSGFNANLQNAGLYNSGIGQNYQTASSLAQNQNAAQNQGFNQGLQGAQFGNTAQQQNLSQQLQLRDLPLNEINSLMSSSQIQNPQFQPYQGTNVQPAPVMQAQQNATNQANNIYNQGVASSNATTGGIASLGSAAMMAFAI